MSSPPNQPFNSGSGQIPLEAPPTPPGADSKKYRATWALTHPDPVAASAVAAQHSTSTVSYILLLSPQTLANELQNLNPSAPAFTPNTDPSISGPLDWPSVTELVQKLLDPPHSCFPKNYKSVNIGHEGKKDQIRLTLHWCKSKIGEQHFVNDPVLSRSVLRADSKVRTHGYVTCIASTHLWNVY